MSRGHEEDIVLWQALDVSGHEDHEEVRCGHGSFAVEDNIFAIGGKNRKNFDVSRLQLTSLNTGSMTKVEIETGKRVEEERFAFAFCYCTEEKSFFMHGGFDSEFNHSGSRFLYWDEATRSFNLHTLEADSNGPSPRGYHSACYFNSKIITFGGQCCIGGPYVFYDDVHCLDLATSKWTQFQTSGQSPSPRSQCFAFIYKNGFYVFGGYDGKNIFIDLHRLDLTTLQWNKLETNGTGRGPLGLRGLSPLDFHIYFCRPAGCVIGKHLVILAENYETASAAVYSLNLKSLEWRKLSGRHSNHIVKKNKEKIKLPFDPPARGNPTLTRCGQKLFMIGGHVRSAGREDHRVWSLTLPQGLDWPRERLLWLACYKNDPRGECLLAKCPPHVIYKIIGYANSNAFYMK